MARPPASVLWAVLTANQVIFSAWDIIAREIFALLEHPFPPLAFMIFRHLFCSLAGVGMALASDGRSYLQEARTDAEVSSRPRSSAQTFLVLIAAATIGPSIGGICYLEGVKLTSATHAAVVQPLIPVITMIIAVVVGMETLGRGKERVGKVTGTLAAVLGSVLVVLGSGHHKSKTQHGQPHHPATSSMATHTNGHETSTENQRHTSSLPFLGTVMLLAGVFFFSAYLLLQPRLLKRYRPAWLAAFMFVFAIPSEVLIFVMFIELEGRPKNLALTWPVAGGMAYCVFSTVFYNGSMTWSSQYLPSSTVALFTCVHPLATAILDSVILGSSLTWYDLLGGLLIILGFFANTSAENSTAKAPKKGDTGSSCGREHGSDGEAEQEADDQIAETQRLVMDNDI